MYTRAFPALSGRGETMDETARTFFAIELTEPARLELQRLRRRLEPLVEHARWVKLSNLHLTLAFLGDVATSRMEELGRQAQEAVVGEVEPFCLRLRGVGAFPNLARPRVLWAGLAGTDLSRLRVLQQAVAQAARDVGCPPTDDRFSPHVTLARFKGVSGGKRPPDLNPTLAEYSAWEGGELGVCEVVLFESILGRDGPIYRAIQRVSLESGKAAL